MEPAGILGRQPYEALIDATGTSALGDVILQLADVAAGVDEVFGYWVEAGAPPVQITSSGRAGSSRARAALYISRYHRLDPLASMIDSAKDGAPTQSLKIVAADIPDPTYRHECFDHPGLFEKIAFIRTLGRRHFVLNFYRRPDRRRDISDRLDAFVELAFPVLRKHVDLMGAEIEMPLTGRLEARIARAYPLLTQREAEVCARTLVGMTAEATALDLGIGETTVLTYRRRAYRRYEISSAGQLIERLLT